MPFIETPKKRILFIHIPKTGGTSIEQALEEFSILRLYTRAIPNFLKVPPEHFTLHNIHALFGDNYFDFIFAVVRNPYDRLESEYRMRGLLAKERFFKELPKFPFWLEQTMETVYRDKHFMANHFRPQIEFVGKGVHVFKYEDGLDRVIAKVNQLCDLNLTLPDKKLLESGRTGSPINWSDECIRLVNQFYDEDFKAFGYKRRQVQFRKA